jgi:endoglucanase
MNHFYLIFSQKNDPFTLKGVQNEPNLNNSESALTSFMTERYFPLDTWYRGKNEPNTNPIRTQFKAKTNPIQAHFERLKPKNKTHLYIPNRAGNDKSCEIFNFQSSSWWRAGWGLKVGIFTKGMLDLLGSVFKLYFRCERQNVFYLNRSNSMRRSKSEAIGLVVLFLLIIFCCPPMVEGKGFLRTRGQDIVDESGEKVMLRGVGLGNWLLPEGYMWKFGPLGDRPRKIEKIVSDLIGPEDAERFWLEFRRHYITEADIKRISEIGFNSVRPALNARRFLTEGDNPSYVDEGFMLLDNLVEWCGKYDIYVIIDMHGAPGGQTGTNIDDSPNDEPELFIEKENQDRLVDLWVKIAERYKNEPTVAAYDLLNEPLPRRTGAADKYKGQLEPLYERLIKAIRKVDSRHMITLEGADWSNDWSVFTRALDDNVFYQFHYYCWDRPDNLKSVREFITRRDELNTPIWVGETGEKGNTIYWGTTQYFETNNIGWSFWPWKKMDTRNTPYSINKPAGWDEIRAYSQGKDKPSKESAKRAFDELIENIKLENCEYFPDVVNAILRRVPGKVEAENYGHEGLNKSFYVKDTDRKAKYYRTSEPVLIELIEGRGNRWISEQCIKLKAGEWTAYDINSSKSQSCEVVVRAKAESLPAAFTLSLNNQAVDINMTETDWVDLKAKEMGLAKGPNKIKITVKSGEACFDRFNFK